MCSGGQHWLDLLDLTKLVCAFHGVSPRDRWLRVLPGWQMNVNVNLRN